LYESEDEFNWVKDLPFPHGHSIDLCNIEGDRDTILKQVFDKLERDGYDKDRLDFYRQITRRGENIVVHLGSNYSKNREKGLEYDSCNIKKKFVNGIYDRSQQSMSQVVPIYRLISYQDFLSI
jgi:mannitol/fructose-specific phosphotransferase system IIA component